MDEKKPSLEYKVSEFEFSLPLPKDLENEIAAYESDKKFIYFGKTVLFFVDGSISGLTTLTKFLENDDAGSRPIRTICSSYSAPTFLDEKRAIGTKGHFDYNSLDYARGIKILALSKEGIGLKDSLFYRLFSGIDKKIVDYMQKQEKLFDKLK